MSYKYTEFDGVTLPQNNPTQVHDTSGARSTLQKSVGGNYDYRGSLVANPEPHILPVSGFYVGEVDFIVDEAGNFLVDEAGNYLISGDAYASMRSQVGAIRAKVRQRAPLWRVWVDDETVREWKTARLLNVRQSVTRNNPVAVADIALDFETMMTNWHAESATVVSGTAANGVPLLLAVSNLGAQIDDAVINVECTSGTITALTVTCVALGVSLAWAGSLGIGDALVIDSRADAPPTGSVDAYDGFTFGAGHSARGWLPIAPGNYLIRLVTTGGNATASLTFYEQSP